jgi:hypothetical protein
MPRRTALHEAAFRADVPVIDALLALGADPTLRDRDYHATPAGWAHHAGHVALAERLQAAADDFGRSSGG